jgi:dTDP-glucose 4,6-dehydratase
MNVLVTGGAGFIGSNFLHYLSGLADGPAKIVNLDKLTYAGNPANLAGLEKDPRHLFVQGDIGDTALVAALLREHRIGAVVHFAAESHVDRSIDSPGDFVETNVTGTFRLLEAARAHWRGLPPGEKEAFRFLHVSTDEVFGSLSPDDPAFHETTPYSPNSPYSASKAASDHFVRAYHHTYGLPTLVTNCSNNYGPRQFPEKLIPLMIANALALRPLPVYGDGGNVRDWLYVEDHCKGVWRVLNAGHPGETYNLGGLNEMTNLALVELLCARLDLLRPRVDGKNHKELVTFVTDRPGHDRRYAIDCGKAISELGWKPEETFSTGLDRTIGWYLAHPEWSEEIRSRAYRQERLGAA